MPTDYRTDTARWPVTGTVYIEAEWNRASSPQESRWVEAIAAQTGIPSAMVAWCDLASANAGELLSLYTSIPIVRGIRHKPAAASSPADAKRGTVGSMDDPAWREGYALLAQTTLTYDLQTPWWHLDAASDLARDFPETQIIINHTGLPADRSPEALAAWRTALEVAAAQPNVAIKISGLGQPGLPWTAEANAPIIRDAIAIFSIDRAMFASNFPVDKLVSDFDTIFSSFLFATADCTEAERDKLFHDNAARFYRLQSVRQQIMQPKNKEES